MRTLVYEGLNAFGGFRPSVYTGLNALQKISLHYAHYAEVATGLLYA